MSEATEGLGEAPVVPDYLRDPLGTVRRRWPWMLGVLVLVGAATAVLALRVELTYLATSTILVSSQRIPEEFVRPTVEDNSVQQINAMVGQVVTRKTLSGLIEEFGLYPELRTTMTMQDLTSLVRQNLTVEPKQGVTRARNETAQLIEVSFEDKDPIKAAEVANEIASLFTAENIRRRSAQARLTTSFLQRELEDAETSLRDQQRRITEFKESHRGELPSELDANLGRLERLQFQRQSLALQIAEASNRITTLSAGQAGVGATTPNQRLADLRAQLESALAVATENHPDVIALRSQIRAVEAELARNPTPSPTRSADAAVGALLAAEQATLSQLRQQLAETEQELAVLDQRVARTPKREEELSALEQRATVLRENYLDFLRMVKEAELAESLESAQHGERFSIIDRAVPPSAPTQARTKYVILGVLVALGMAVGTGVLLEVIDPTLFHASQLERVTDLPVLGSVPHIP